MADQQCPDCHVQPGQPHHLGCDMARCPACGIQRLQCNTHADDRTLDARAVWTGAAPTVAGDYRQRIAYALLARLQADGPTPSQYDLADAVLAVDTEDAESEVERLATDLYKAQDALAWIGECCDVADTLGGPLSTADVRSWLEGPKCGRQMLAEQGDRKVLVSAADLDLVMYHAGDPATVAEYPAAAQRIQDALGGRRG